MSEFLLRSNRFYETENEKYVHIVGRKFVKSKDHFCKTPRPLYIGYTLDQETGLAEYELSFILYEENGEPHSLYMSEFRVIEEIKVDPLKSLPSRTFYMVLRKEEYDSISAPSSEPGVDRRKYLYKSMETAMEISAHIPQAVILEVKPEEDGVPKSVKAAYDMHFGHHF